MKHIPQAVSRKSKDGIAYAGVGEKFILTGYRKPMNFKECIHSVFAIHNQTGDIWTCLIPLIISSFLFVRTLLYVPSYEIFPRTTKTLSLFNMMDVQLDEYFFTWSYKLVFAVYQLCLIFAFLASTMFHILESYQSIYAKKTIAALDYAGIFLIGMGSALPGIYYGFLLYPNLHLIYLSFNFINAITGIIVSWSDSFYRVRQLRIFAGNKLPKSYLTYKVCTAASFGVVFVVHLAVVLPQEEFLMMFKPIAIYYGSMAFALFFYASRYPERASPGHFDLWCKSHQLWHIVACIGIFYLMNGWMDYAKWKQNSILQ